jgi:hypothetical protein
MKKIYTGFVLLGTLAVTNDAFACKDGIGADCPKISIDSCSSSSSSSSSCGDEKFGAASLYTTSGASRAAGTVFKSVVDKSATTRNQQQLLTNIATGGLHLSVADLRYEHADFRAFNNSGDIGGFTASGSYEFNDTFSVGGLIPYDYMSFEMFEAHRTGFIGYGKGKWNVLQGMELSAIVNGNYIYTGTDYNGAANTADVHTYGGGFSTRLDYDKGGDFLSALAFSIQYNQDNSKALDDHQYLIKLAPSVGYRIGDNAVVKVFGAWNNDVTHYRTVGNKLKDSEFFDLGIEGNYNISETWQLKGGYKKILDLQAFDSDAFYLGSSLSF